MDAANHSPELLELLSVHALGALDGEDLRAVEAHLATGCSECQARLAELSAEVEALAASLPPVTPAETTRARLLGKLPPAEPLVPPSPADADRERRGSRPRRSASGWLAAALVLLAAGTSGWGWLAARREADSLRAGRGDLDRQVAALGGDLDAARAKSDMLARELAAAREKNDALARDMAAAQAEREKLARDAASAGGERTALARDLAAIRAENARLARDVTALREQNVRLARAMATISAPGMRPVALAALKAPAGAQGYAFVDPAGHRAVFVAANLPALPADKTYELWFIADGKPVAAGTFGVDPSGRSGTVEVSGVAPVDRIQAWAVTIEPQGGVPQPTGTMVLKG